MTKVAHSCFHRVASTRLKQQCHVKIAEHEIPELMACREEFGPARPFRGLNTNIFFARDRSWHCVHSSGSHFGYVLQGAVP